MTEQIGLEAIFEDRAFQAGVDRYNRAIGDMVGNTTSGASSMGAQFSGMGTKILSVASMLGTAVVAGAGAATVAIGAFVASGVSAAADLEKQLDGISSVLGATQEEIGQLSDLIINLGLNPNLQVTATEAADAIDMLARNGLSATEILEGAAEATVLLANATGADFSTSANIATDAMSLFNIEAGDMLEAVNGITSVTAGSKFDMNDYALALAQAGGVAATAGVSFDDFNTSISAISPLFASGSDAGTAFKTMLQRLIPSSNKAEDLMRELGLITEETGNAFFDSEGNMKSMNEIAVILNTTMADMSEEQRLATMSTLFGTDAMRAAVGMMDSGAIAYTDAAAAAAELGVSIDDANQFIDGGITKYEALMLQMGQTDAVESAATRMDNLAGAVEILGGIFDAIKLQVGQAFLPLIRQVVDEVSAFLADNQETVVAFFSAVATGVSTFVEAIAEGESPITAFFDALAAAGVDESTITSIEEIVTAIQDFVGEIVAFVTEHSEAFKGALIGIGAVLGSSVIVAIIAGIVAALSALATPLTAIIAAAALLGAAWSENWGGIRDTVTDAWNDLQPTFQTIKDWLETNIPVAIETVTTAFNNISDWFNDNKQTILDFVDNTIGKVGDAWGTTGSAIGELLSGSFAKLQTWFTDNKPLIEDFAKVVGTVLAAAGFVLAKVWTAAHVALAAFVEKISLPFLDTLIDYILNFVTFLMQIFTGDFAGAADSLVNGWKLIGEAILGILAGIIDWVSGWFGSSLEEIGTVWGGIWDNVTAIVTLAWENIKELFGSAWLTIQAIWDAAVSAVATGWAAFWDGLKLTVETIWTAITTFITDAFTTLSTGWTTFWDGLKLTVETIWTAVITFINDTIASFVAGWNTFWDGVKLTIETIWNAIKTFVTDAITSLFEGMGLSLDDMKERWSTIWDDVLLIIQTIWTMITTWIGTKITEVQTIITTIVTAIQTWWETTWTAISTTATTIWTAITTAVSTAITGIQTAITTIVTAIQTWWETTWTAISTTVETIWTAITTAVSDKVNAVKTDVETVVGEVKTWWETTWNEIKTKVTEIWTEIVTAVGDKLEEVRTSVEEKVNAVKEWIGQQVEAFKGVGEDIITGLKDGILAAGGAVLEAITGVVEDAVAAAKALLGIASPSKVFAEIGKFSIEGLIAGITSMKPELETTMDGMVGAMLDFGSKLGGFGSSMAARFKEETLDPMKANMDALEKTLTDKEKAHEDFQAEWAQSLGMTREELMANLPRLHLEAVMGGDETFLDNLARMNAMTQEIDGSQEQLTAAAAAYAKEQEKILLLEKQRQDMQFLQQQLDLLKTIRDAGLDPADILGGMQLGLEASVPDLMAAMSNAMQAIVDAANGELQIASPSKVFQKIAGNIIAGLADGLKKTGPVVNAIADMSKKMVGNVMGVVNDIAAATKPTLPTINDAMRPGLPAMPPINSSRPVMPAPVVNVDAAAPQYHGTFTTNQSPITLKRAFRQLELSHA